MKIRIAHLYPDLLNLYGDNGNITAMCYRLEKRGIEAEVSEYYIDDTVNFENTDILFIGGGSDKELRTVCNKMCEYKDDVKAFAENGGCILAVCGGFQLMGNYYMLGDEKINALGVLDIHFDHAEKRIIGDVVASCDTVAHTIVGFENHSAIAHIGSYTPLAKIIYGKGNDGEGTYEGLIHNNVICSFMHGPLLPKNPALTDYILSCAIERKYGEYTLAPLDDTLENMAHEYIVRRFSDEKGR